MKAGAELRLARNLRKAGRAEAALEIYGDLAKVTDVGLSGVPADLVASRARCALLEELGRTEQLRTGSAGPGRGPAGWPLATRSRVVALLRRAGESVARNGP